jgi:FG-GAP-like repeat
MARWRAATRSTLRPSVRGDSNPRRACCSSRHLAGTGDFNGDERFDILWRDDDGSVRLWEMDGANIVTETNLGTFRDYWQIADLGDYNGDLNSDILWRDTAGTLVLWEMDGHTIVANTAVNTIATHWRGGVTYDSIRCRRPA